MKLGRSRLPASAWLSWSTSYMLYDGFPISTFIPPFVMGCLWTRFPLRCVEPGIINIIRNMQVNMLHSFARYHTTNHIILLLAHLEYITLLGRTKKLNYNQGLSAEDRCSAEESEANKLFIYQAVHSSTKLCSDRLIICWCLEASLLFRFYYLFTYLCLRLQM